MSSQSGGVAKVGWEQEQQSGSGPGFLESFRESLLDLCDVTPLSGVDNFQFTSTSRFLGSGVLLESTTSELRYDRELSHIARSGFDAYQIGVYLKGGADFSSGRRKSFLKPGEIFLIDMAETSRNYLVDGAHVAAVMVPRSLFAPLVQTPDSLQGRSLTQHSPFGQLAFEELLRIRSESHRTSSSVSLTTLLSLVAGAVGQASGSEERVEQAAQKATLEAIKQLIEANLDREEVGVESLCLRFGISRATLYRMFEQEGGLESYRLKRKLHRAFLKLISPAYGQNRIIDLAMDYGFSSDNTFIRAFRRTYGVTPGELRALALSRNGRQGERQGRDHSSLPVATLAWLHAQSGI